MHSQMTMNLKLNPIHLFIFLFNFISDSELEELETTPRYRPDSLSALCRATRFSSNELKRIYRGFKAECPTGVVKEDAFKVIYSQFFPQGGLYSMFHAYLLIPCDLFFMFDCVVLPTIILFSRPKFFSNIKFITVYFTYICLFKQIMRKRFSFNHICFVWIGG